MIIDRGTEACSCWGGKLIDTSKLYNDKFTLRQVTRVPAPEAETLEESLNILLTQEPGIILLDGQFLCALLRKRCMTKTPAWQRPGFNGYDSIHFAASPVEFPYKNTFYLGYPSLFVESDGVTPGDIVNPLPESLKGANHFFAILDV